MKTKCTRWTAAILLGCCLSISSCGCALIQLPLAIVGATLAIVQIPINLALSLIGPATNAAATAAPYALMFAKLDPNEKGWSLVLFENKTGKSRKEFFEEVRRFAEGHRVAAAYPHTADGIKNLVLANTMKCYLVRV